VTSGTIRLACSTIAKGQFIHRKIFDEPGTEDATFVLLPVGDKDQEFRFQIDCLNNMPKGSDEEVYLVPILSGRTGSARGPIGQDPIQELMVQGIVLQAVGTNKGEYSRIGSFQFYKNAVEFDDYDHQKEQSYDAFLQVLEEHGTARAVAACSHVVDTAEYPDQRHVITLV